MSLEEDLAKTMTLSDADLRKKTEALPSGQDVGQALIFYNREMVSPLLAAHRNAILRLAREVDELRGSK